MEKREGQQSHEYMPVKVIMTFPKLKMWFKKYSKEQKEDFRKYRNSNPNNKTEKRLEKNFTVFTTLLGLISETEDEILFIERFNDLDFMDRQMFIEKVERI